MQYLITAYDFRDDDALNRRMKAREQHLTLMAQLKKEGKMLYGAAILNAQEQMVGSILIGEFATRIELDEWLKIEPYVTEKVWDSLEIKPCKVGSVFLN
jgi:uncharacterized protein YciI